MTAINSTQVWWTLDSVPLHQYHL